MIYIDNEVLTTKHNQMEPSLAVQGSGWIFGLNEIRVAGWDWSDPKYLSQTQPGRERNYFLGISTISIVTASNISHCV